MLAALNPVRADTAVGV